MTAVTRRLDQALNSVDQALNSGAGIPTLGQVDELADAARAALAELRELSGAQPETWRAVLDAFRASLRKGYHHNRGALAAALHHLDREATR